MIDVSIMAKLPMSDIFLLSNIISVIKTNWVILSFINFSIMSFCQYSQYY